MLRPDLATVTAYQEPDKQPIDLASNTNLFGRNPALDVDVADPWAYPPAGAPALVTAAARHYGVGPDQVAATAGSDQALDLLLRAMLRPGDAVAVHNPTFAMAQVYARANHGRIIDVPLTDGALDVEAFASAPVRVRYLCRPNNPTGSACTRRDVERLLEAEGLLVVDEAYAEFMGEDVLDLVGHPRLVVLRTLSKAHGLAGIRTGFALGPAPLVAAIDGIGGPYRLNAWSIAVATRALEDVAFMRKSVDQTLAMRSRWQAALQQRGFQAPSSQANFVLARMPEHWAMDGAALAQALAAHGIGIRHFCVPLLRHVRFTVGPQDFLDRTSQALDAIGGNL